MSGTAHCSDWNFWSGLTSPRRKNLIEVALPLKATNEASAREKAIRHGHGHSDSFSALLEILDPQRFCRGVPVKKSMLDEVMVSLLKDDIREIFGGFPKRCVVQMNIDGLPADAHELRLSSLLDEYRRLREQRLSGEPKRKQAAAGLLITNLQQRLLSSIEAFSRTLRVHRRTVQGAVGIDPVGRHKAEVT